MHFNTKYIFKGESEHEIIAKINDNFNQIISFAVGPNGQRGPKGPRGFPGPAGRKGLTGPTGTRGTLITKQNFAPATGSSNPYDYWIDTSSSEYEIYHYGITGSGNWVYSGYSLFSSPYFSIYEGIIGPGGAKDKNAIAFNGSASFLINNQLSVSDACLVVSDDLLNVNSNPNRSKLLISTADQTTRPILSFSKTGASLSDIPSFYWSGLGNSTDLSYVSSADLEISSLLGLTVDSFTANSFLNGNSMTLSSGSSISIGGTGDFYLFSNVTTGVGTDLVISASNVTLNSSSLNFRGSFRILNTSSSSGYVLDVTKQSTSSLSTSGVEIISGPSTSWMFDFRDSNNASLLSTRVKGSPTGTNYGQTNFGSTGGVPAGGTSGPYFYHVKRATEYRQGMISQFCIPAGTSYSTITGGVSNRTVPNIFDLSSPNLWDSDVIIISPTLYTSFVIGGTDTSVPVYIKVPTSIETTLNGLYYPTLANNYRVLLNDLSTTPIGHLAGLVLDYRFFSGGSNNPVISTVYVPFRSGSTSCFYVDLFFSSPASGINANPRIFWKTCNGKGGFITTTNRFPLST